MTPYTAGTFRWANEANYTGAILSLDWCFSAGSTGPGDDGSSSMVKSWIVSGSLDPTVKVCRLTVFPALFLMQKRSVTGQGPARLRTYKPSQCIRYIQLTPYAVSSGGPTTHASLRSSQTPRLALGVVPS